MTDAVSLGGPLHRVGALSYDRGNLGRVEEKVGTVTHIEAEPSHRVGGEFIQDDDVFQMTAALALNEKRNLRSLGASVFGTGAGQ